MPALTPAPTAPLRTMSQENFDAAMAAEIAWRATNVTEMNLLLNTMSAIASGAACSIPYTFSTTTTDSDPGAGYLRLDNATQNAATTIRLDLAGSDGATWTSLIDTFDDSTSTIKGHIMLQKASDASKWLLFSVSALASPSGYRNVTIAGVASSEVSPFVNGDNVLLKFTRNGDKGDTGATGAAAYSGYSARTTNTQLAAGDVGKLIEITSGSFTQTFAACSGLGPNWYVWYKNSSTNDITLDPNASELIDGVTSGVIKPGMTFFITCDGSSLQVTRVDANTITEIKTSGTSGTWPLGVRRAKLRMTGGGASGVYTGGSTRSTGAAAGYLEKTLTVSPGTTYTYSVGAGGVGVSSGSSGTTGGASTFTVNAVTYTTNGGSAANQFGLNVGGTAVNGDINVQGGPGMTSTNQYTALGGSTPLGEGGTDGQPGSGFGAGGGGSTLPGVATPAGAPGVIILEY